MASAGVWLVETGTDFLTGAPLASTIRLDAERASIEIRDAKQHQTIIYQSSPKKVWMIDHEQRFYRVLGDESLTTLRKRLSGVQKEMRRRADEQLADMTEEQRRALADAMKKRSDDQAGGMPPGDAFEAEFTQVWKDESVNGRKCEKYEGRRNGRKVWDVCAVPWNRLDVDRADFAALGEVIAYLSTLRLWSEGSVIEPGPVNWKEQKLYPGLPVQRIRYANDRPVEVFEVREIERREFSSADFEVPRDYMEREVLWLAPEAAVENSTGKNP
jgi:hypothetical protein